MNVSVKGLHFAYGDRPVLKDVCLEAGAGHLVAILGPNGSGKTTLLKLIGRILKPPRGTVWLDRRDVNRLSRSALARRLAYMPQTQVGTGCTVFDAVLLGRLARFQDGRPGPEDLAKVREVMSFVDIDRLAMRRTNRLSGGELQKVVLGRALAQQPEVLLLDEPISHLDPVNQIEVMDLLRSVTVRLDICSLLVTHDLNSAMRFADRFILLRQGCVVARGGREVITPEIIRAVYGIRVVVAEVAGIPVVLPQQTANEGNRAVNRPGRK